MNVSCLLTESASTRDVGASIFDEFSVHLENCFKSDVNVCFDKENPIDNRLTNLGLFSFDVSAELTNSTLFDWRETHLHQAYLTALNLNPCEANKHKVVIEGTDADDEELSCAFDHHSLITSQLPVSYDEPVKMADEVIREIDLIMGHTEDVSFPSISDAGNRDFLPVIQNQENEMLTESELQRLPLNVLNSILDDTEAYASESSAILVQELAYREELEFEQEQKDIFITRLDELHRRLERRRRRSSMPPMGIRGRTTSMRRGDASPRLADYSQLKAEPLASHHPPPMLRDQLREVDKKCPADDIKSSSQMNSDAAAPECQGSSLAHSAAQAAVAAAFSATSLLRRQWHRLSRGPDELTSLVCHDSSAPGCQPASAAAVSASSTAPSAATVNPRAVILARFRKWARAGRCAHTQTSNGRCNGRPIAAPLNQSAGGGSGLPCRGGTAANKCSQCPHYQHSHHHYYYPPCLREARSAVTTPTASPSTSLLMDDNLEDLPSVPCQLTHSASGNLMGGSGSDGGGGVGDLAAGGRGVSRPLAGPLPRDDLDYQNLTTTIPYHRAGRDGPTVDQLQLFNEMLLAILTNSPNLTNMLTDYILNVYAPADRCPSKLPI